MGVSKVVYGDNTLVDLTNDSVSAATLAKGVTAHNAAGDQVTGIMEAGTSVTKETITEALGYTPTKAWYVTFTADDDDNVTADKTIAEIYQAYQDGYAVYGVYEDLVFQLSNAESDLAVFSFIYNTDGGAISYTIGWDSKALKWLFVANQYYNTESIGTLLGNIQTSLIVNVTASKIPSGETSSSASSDTTNTEIYEACNAGRPVFAKIAYNNERESYIVPLITVHSGYAFFSGVIYNGADCGLLQVVCMVNNEWTFYNTTLSDLYATKAEIPDETTLVNKVLAALPTWTGGSY